MFTVPAIPLSEIDGWTIEDAGFSARIVNAATRAGIETVRDIRTRSDADLIGMASIGPASVDEVRRFWARCQAIAAGQCYFLTLPDAIEPFVDTENWAVLIRRYGLYRPDPAASRKFMTLQEIGNELNLTRERIRQVEAQALHSLRANLPRHCLSPFLRYLRAFIESRQGVVSTADLQDLEGQSWLAGLNPCSVFLLLHDIDAHYFQRHNQLFHIYSEIEIDAAAQEAVEWLNQQNELASLQKLWDAIHGQLSLTAPVALAKIIAQVPEILSTIDQQYLTTPTALDDLLRELLEAEQEPLHYREITTLLNQRLLRACRKGPGHVLRHLNASELFQKTARGKYAVKRG